MTDRLAEILQRQEEYLKSLAPIYLSHSREISWHAVPFPWPIDGRVAQEGFRLLAWRCTEEVIEAIELHYNHADSVTEYTEKFNEEIADAFHFLIELTLALGIGEQELISGIEGVHKFNSTNDYLSSTFKFVGNGGGETIPQRWGMFVFQLGLAMHELRQRPWRTDDRPTNRQRLVARMNAAFITFICACRRSDISADDLYRSYFAKNAINLQRRDANMPAQEPNANDQDLP
jgi:dimeric dUTPase (all-alpha-NTP-PPase superfamily)